MKFVFDLDGTLCSITAGNEYNKAIPFADRIHEVNRLHAAGHYITIFTARGASSGLNWHYTTIAQLEKWGVKYSELRDSGKPSGDVYIDDKAISVSDWVKTWKPKKIGFVASAFDLLHAGHCLMLKDAKSQCDYLIAALQTDPTLDRPEKNKPIQSLEERRIQLESNKYVDEIVTYDTELDLVKILMEKKPHVRIVGSDWKTKTITGDMLCNELYFHERNHNWSSSSLRERIKQ
jgi:glycerol-3-phosphate cytidylyltransferase